MRHIAYISVDGLLEPLGASQVQKVLEGLSVPGDIRFTVFSLEKPKSLVDRHHVTLTRRTLAKQNIHWLHYPYQNGLKGIFKNLATLTQAVDDLVENDSVCLIHARSYLAGLIAQVMWIAHGIPYVFDFRGYWIDERIEEGRWFTNSLAIAGGRSIERHLFQNAHAIVSLTESAAEDIRTGKFGKVRDSSVFVIPTCVDGTAFQLAARDVQRPSQLRGKNVVGYVGSLNASYLVEESLRLVAYILKTDPSAFFLGLTGQTSELERSALSAGIPAERMLIRGVAHSEMPQWLGWIDWGLLLLQTNAAKRASMPTKLAEFLAVGVRPIHHGCNEDVAFWVRKAGTGLSLSTLDEYSMAKIARALAATSSDSELIEGWQRTSQHFSMETGVLRYREIYDHVLKQAS